MISKLAERLTEKLIKSKEIKETDRELYVYGLFMLLSQILFLIVAIIAGLAFSCITQGIIFYVAFQLIRKYAGGFHAKTELRCDIMTTLCIVTCIACIKFSQTHNIQTAMIALAVASAICILALCPLDTPEKPLTEKEAKYFRKISLIILFVICVLIAISFFFKLKIALVPLCLSLILESALLISGKIKSKLVER